MDAHEDKVSTAAATETTLKQEDPGQRSNNPTEGNSTSIGVEVSTDPRPGEDADDTEERRVSKLECFTCGILRRRRARGRKTPRLEFVEDPPQQQQEALGAPSAENSGGPREPDSSGAGAAELGSPELKESATEGETSAVKQEIADGANPRETANAEEAAKEPTEVEETETEQKINGEATETQQEKNTDKQD